ncbi:uncharacterized protein LOC127704219 [Mytilus californianus]|uniref:uncharacterized protein LOC127704219 n=1 Tax=Mytilus californianus TaxID=6549 RepID=UPI0022464356|nr:uncharacterized protein LOC127704219 [Mytilus californianus]XP_052064128.1 uncharacterized protein LOC127704219 [Mytilus californianus]XP_052064129.1 uncharacterized protein LOC127704219 [Mytilus californianus]XP_052064130.1 uncharacterized protein LOC127704219 [Mytilus californianus]
MDSDQNDEIIKLKQQLVEKDQELSKLREEKDLLEESLEETEETVKEARTGFQKRIDELTNDIEEKDEQIDTLTGEVTQLKKNNQTQDNSPEVVNSLKEQLLLKDETVSEIREKLHKGGMTINNLHMEIGDLKDNLSSAKDSITSKSEKIKEMRDENSQLKSSMSELQSKLDNLQTIPEGSEISVDNEGGKVQMEVLKKEMTRKNEDLMSLRIQLEKCQKQLNDISKSPKSTEPDENQHSTNDPTKDHDEMTQEKSKIKDLELQLEKAQSDNIKILIGFALLVLVIAVLLAKLIY